jgi:prophage regulatory protein
MVIRYDPAARVGNGVGTGGDAAAQTERQDGLDTLRSRPALGWRPKLRAQSELRATGFLRLPNILAPIGPIPVSRSTWWAGVREGRYPAPVKLGPPITAWRVEDIRNLIERGMVPRPAGGAQ